MTRTHWILTAAVVLTLITVAQRNLPASAAPPVPATVTAAPVPVRSPDIVFATAQPAGLKTVALTPIAKPGGTALQLSATLSSDKVLKGSSDVFARLDVAAPEAAGPEVVRRPVNLAIAIDCSGSMTGPKIENAKAATLALIDQLRAGDRLALVAFSGGTLVYPLRPVTNDSLAEMRRFASQLYAGGGTDIGAALGVAEHELTAATRAPGAISRIILLSDGRPSEGITDHASLAAIVDTARKSDISTSAFGVGLDFDGTLMQSLAEHGGGGYAFIDNVSRMNEALANELRNTSSTIARQVRVSVKLPAGVSFVDSPGHPFTRTGNRVDLPLYDFFPGQVAQVLVQLKVNQAAAGTVKIADVGLSYIDVKHEVEMATADVPLSAEATDNAEAVNLAGHADVVSMAKSVEVNVKLAEAAHAYEAGDSKSAIGIIDNIHRLFGMSADSLAGDDMISIRNSMNAGGDQGNRAVKGLTMKTMKNFGQNNTSQY